MSYITRLKSERVLTCFEQAHCLSCRILRNSLGCTENSSAISRTVIVSFAVNPTLYVFNRDFQVLRIKASVDECVIHDLRRSAITNWAKKLPIQVVQQLAGHADISTTRKYYLAVRSEDLVSANSFLNEILAKVKTN